MSDSATNTYFNSSVTTKSDVPDFQPFILNEGIHKPSPKFFEQLLTKIINAEQACYKSSVFLSLEQRTRLTMLSQMSDTLVTETNKYLKPPNSRGSSVDENALSYKDRGILKNMRSLLTKRSRSKSFLTPPTPNNSLEIKSSGSNTLGLPLSNQGHPLLSPNTSLGTSGLKFKHQYLSTGNYYFCDS